MAVIRQKAYKYRLYPTDEHATQLARTFGCARFVFVEGLNVVGMFRNHALATSISNTAWSEMLKQLRYKAAWYVREYVELDRCFPSSKLCSACGHLLIELQLVVRQWECPHCRASHERGTNAARDLKLAGLYLLKTVRATATRSNTGKVTPPRDERRRPAEEASYF